MLIVLLGLMSCKVQRLGGMAFSSQPFTPEVECPCALNYKRESPYALNYAKSVYYSWHLISPKSRSDLSDFPTGPEQQMCVAAKQISCEHCVTNNIYIYIYIYIYI